MAARVPDLRAPHEALSQPRTTSHRESRMFATATTTAATAIRAALAIEITDLTILRDQATYQAGIHHEAGNTTDHEHAVRFAADCQADIDRLREHLAASRTTI
jgi:hypothetical protein